MNKEEKKYSHYVSIEFEVESDNEIPTEEEIKKNLQEHLKKCEELNSGEFFELLDTIDLEPERPV